MEAQTEPLTRNERVILTLMRQSKSMSKGDISALGHMAWATSVKLIHRLEKRGWVSETDTPEKQGKPGRNGHTYRLSSDAPIAVGVDVEYSSTNILLTNLHGDILAERQFPTPQQPTVSTLQAFLEALIGDFIRMFVLDRSALQGIGIGLPGVVIPAWIKPDPGENRQQLEQHLSEVFQLPVAIEINVRAYTNYMKWQNTYFPGKDFALVSIRTGIGMGIILNGQSVVGHQFIGGEIGHIKVTDAPLKCRCGGTGCLETVVNEHQLYRLYQERVLQRSPDTTPDRAETEQAISELFTAAAEGNARAVSVLQAVAKDIAKALSSCLMMLFIPNIILCGHLGPDGQVIVPMIQAEMKHQLLPSMEVRMVYQSFERIHYAHGAALLLLEKYLDFNSAWLSGDKQAIGSH